MDLFLEKYMNNEFANTVKRDYEIRNFCKIQSRQNAN